VSGSADEAANGRVGGSVNGGKIIEIDTAEIYKSLNTVLEDIRNGRKEREEGRRERRRILVD